MFQKLLWPLVSFFLRSKNKRMYKCFTCGEWRNQASLSTGCWRETGLLFSPGKARTSDVSYLILASHLSLSSGAFSNTPGYLDNLFVFSAVLRPSVRPRAFAVCYACSATPLASLMQVWHCPKSLLVTWRMA